MRALRVPVVFANQVGSLAPMGGALGRLMNPKIYRLRGQSRIVDSDGSVLADLAEQEGVLVAGAVMDPDRRHHQPQPSFGGWLQPGPALARKVVIPLGIASGTLSYSLSLDRRRKAQAQTQGTGMPGRNNRTPTGPFSYRLAAQPRKAAIPAGGSWRRNCLAAADTPRSITSEAAGAPDFTIGKVRRAAATRAP